MRKEKYYKVYQTWSDMKYKCNNPNARTFGAFGARGISYTSEWEKYESFREDMLPSYLELLETGLEPRRITLGRINRDGDFSPSNCKWTTIIENNKVLSSEKYNFLVAQKEGEQKRVFSSLQDLAKFYGVSRSGASKALNKGNKKIRDISFSKITPEEYNKALKDNNFLQSLTTV